jgi:hypothetical protein
MPRSAPIAIAVRKVSWHCDDLSKHAFFFQARGLFNRDLVEGVHAHFDVSDVYARAVCLDANLHVVVHHAFDWNQNFHFTLSKIRFLQKSTVVR